MKPFGCPSTSISEDGAFIVATGDPDHPDYGPFGDNPSCGTLAVPTYVFDRDGNTIVTLPPEPPASARDNRAQLADAVLARTGARLILRSRPSSDVLKDMPLGVTALKFSADETLTLVTTAHEVRLYRAEER